MSECSAGRKRGPAAQLTRTSSDCAASGLGIAICHSMTFYVTLLSETTGPGTYFCEDWPDCPCSVSIFTVGGELQGAVGVNTRFDARYLCAAVFSASFSVLHVAWMVMCFLGYARISVEMQPEDSTSLCAKLRFGWWRWQTLIFVFVSHLAASLLVSYAPRLCPPVQVASDSVCTLPDDECTAGLLCGDGCVV